MTLYDQNPAAWDALAASGRENLRIMAKMFDRCADMDRALGFDGATKHWHHGKNNANMSSDRRAAQWLAAQGKAAVAKPAAPQEPAAQGTMLLVVVPAGMDAKVAKVLGILGCDVTEV